MPILDAIVRPFLEDNARPALRRRWLIVLLAAPALLAAGFWLQARNNQQRKFTISTSREKAIAIARQVAAENGLDASTWTPYVRLEQNEKTTRYFQQPGINHGARSRQLAPDSIVSTLLVQYGGIWCRVATGPDGFVIASEFAGRGYRPKTEGFTEAQSRAAAEAALRQWLGDIPLARLGEPEISTAEDGGANARRFVWRAQPRRLPELEFVFTFEVAGVTITRREVETNFAESFTTRALTPRTSLQLLAGMLRAYIVVLLALYAGYRFARRALEHEAPHRRAFLLGFALLAAGAATIAADPYIHIDDLRPDRIAGPVLVVHLLALLAGFLLRSLMMGISYGAGEGEVREGWPGKLTSLDALLSGRILSANAGASAVAGLACAAWLFFLSQAAFAVLAPGAGLSAAYFLPLSFSRAPLLQLLLNLPILGLLNSVLYLLVPLTFLRRHIRVTPLMVPILVLIALVGGKLPLSTEVSNPAYWVETAGMAAAILVPFFLADYLASVFAALALSFLLVFGDLAARMPYWQGQTVAMAALAAATILPFVYAAWRGRRYEDEEVRPAHARNLIQRLSLQAEVNAARQAQMRLLPEHPPRVAGLSIAASCTPAGDVGGDFYDFFPFPGGRLGVIVAEGGNDGLASALTIALAKGFLRYEAAENSDIEQILSRLDQALGASLQRVSGRTSLALFLMDPVQGVLRMARIGPYPRVLVLSADHAVSEFVPLPHEAGLSVESAHLALMPGDFIFIHTDGLPRLLSRHSAGAPSDLLLQAAHMRHGDSATSLHNTIVDLVLASRPETALDLPDDLTAVTIRFETALGRTEAVA